MSSIFPIGFHTGPGGNPTGIGKPDGYMPVLSSAGIPPLIKSTDHYGIIYEALGYIGAGVDPICVFRLTTKGQDDGVQYDVPDYSQEPNDAARLQFNAHLRKLPPEFDRDRVWLEIVNEVDKDNADWVGWFSYYASELAKSAGIRIALPSWSFGTPEPEAWKTPGMQAFLDAAIESPDRIAVSIHEYSGTKDNIFERFPYHIGRFEQMFDACRELGYADHPTTLVTEFGWEYEDVPGVDKAAEDIRAVAALYGRYERLYGFIWYLGGGFGGIADKVQPLIRKVTDMAINWEGGDPPPPPVDTVEDAVLDAGKDAIVLSLYPPAAIQTEINRRGWWATGNETHIEYDGRPIVVQSAEDPETGDQAVAWCYVPQWNVVHWTPRDDTPPPPPPDEFRYLSWPTDYRVLTQIWGNNPEYYRQWGLPGHDGVDIRAPHGTNVYAVAAGEVYRVENNPDVHNYGIHVRLEHLAGEKTIYAHLSKALVRLGDRVDPGQLIGYADSTGNSSGSHLHFGRKTPKTYVDQHGEWPYNLANPTHLLNAIPDLPPQPEGNAGLGLHGTADGDGHMWSEAEFAEFRDAQVNCIKVLSATNPMSVARLSREHPNAAFIVRAFLHFGGRNISPDQFVTDTVTDVIRTIEAIGLREIVVELHNEPNLASEGMISTWNNGSAFNSWLADVLSEYRKRIPGMNFMYPGLSPGPGQPGFRQQYLDFLSQSANVATACDSIGVHAYWNTLSGTRDTLDVALSVVDSVANRYPRKDIWITECSNNKEDSPRNKGDQYVRFWRELKKRSNVRGVTYFVSSASSPDFADEVWVGKGIGAIVGAR